MVNTKNVAIYDTKDLLRRMIKVKTQLDVIRIMNKDSKGFRVLNIVNRNLPYFG